MDVMPKKKEEIKKELHEEVKEEKPQVMLETEVIESKAVEPTVNPVIQLASVVDPPAATPPTTPPVSTPPFEELPRKEVKASFWPVWIAVAFILGAGAGFALSRINFENKAKVESNKAVVSVEPTMVPTVTPQKTFDRSSLKVEVLNGSGVRGKAAMAKDYLEGLGYKDVATGNADSDNNDLTQISVKASLNDFADKIKADLAAKYQLDSSLKTLATDDDFDVLVILGKK